MLETFVKDCIPWEGPHAGAWGQREEGAEDKGEAEEGDEELWPAHSPPFPIPLCHWGGGRIVGSEVEEKSGLSFYFSRSCSGINWQDIKLFFPKQSPFCLWQ